MKTKCTHSSYFCMLHISTVFLFSCEDVFNFGNQTKNIAVWFYNNSNKKKKQCCVFFFRKLLTFWTICTYLTIESCFLVMCVWPGAEKESYQKSIFHKIIVTERQNCYYYKSVLRVTKRRTKQTEHRYMHLVLFST